MAGNRDSTISGVALVGAMTLLGAGTQGGCLPEDTRPVPATVYTDFALASTGDTDLSDGLSFTTDDGYEVTITQLFLTLGRVVFSGDDCNMYTQQDLGNFYSRVIDALQPEDQRLATSFAIGDCSMGFTMHAPEDWAHVGNPGSSEQLRDSLRAVNFPNQQMIDEFAGPRGSKGVSLRIGGVGRPVAAEGESTPFLFEFGTQSSSLLCGPDNEEFFPLEGGTELTTVVEMFPHHLFGRCGSEDLVLFEPIAQTPSSGPNGVVVLEDLEQVMLSSDQRSFPDGMYFCDPTNAIEDAQSGVEREQLAEAFEQLAPANLRTALARNAALGLFGVRGGSCRLEAETRRIEP